MSSTPLPDSSEALREAKDLFRQGNALRETGDYDRALEFYLRSRALVPSLPNTLNAALCLDQLGRYDEALDLYEELVTRFGDALTDADREAIVPAMAALRKKLGRMEVSANVDGTLVIDGRPRGQLPVRGPIALMPGVHVVRVLKDGYETFETEVTIKAGQAATIDARLKHLAHAGKLRIEAKELLGADVYIDGGLVGKTPWEGTLTPGTHVYVVQLADRGTVPLRAIVVEGQTVLVDTEAKPLGPSVRIAPIPLTALLSIGGVQVGKGAWQGRLPIGRHVLEATESGYHPSSSIIDVTADTPPRLTIQLHVDPDHPRWAVPRPGRFWLSAWGGFLLGSSLGSDAESSCGSGDCALAMGAMTGLTGGYEFPARVSVQAGVGYLGLGRNASRQVRSSFGRPDAATETTYDYDDHIRISGFHASAGMGYRRAVRGPIDWEGSLQLGLLVASAKDGMRATATAMGRTLEAEVEGSDGSVQSIAFFLLPQVGGRWNFRKLFVRAGVSALVLPLDGPRLGTGDTRVLAGTCTPQAAPLPIDCAPGDRAVAGERVFGRSVLWMPYVGAGTVF